MSDFREKQTVDDGQIGSDVSDEEEHTTRITKSRLIAVPKRKTQLLMSNGGVATSAESDAEQQADSASGCAMPHPITSKSAGHLWTDTVLMQSLEDKMGGSAGPGATIAELRDRGAETYALKKTETYALKKAGGKRRQNDDIADVMMEEEMERHQMGGTNDTKIGLLEGEETKRRTEGDDADEALSVAVDSSVSLWEGVDTGSAELPTEQSHSRRGKWKRFKQNNRRHHQTQSHPWRKPFKKGLKMFKNEAKTAAEREDGEKQVPQKQRKMVPPEKFVPHKLLTADYATEKLLEAEFDADALSEEQLAQGLTETLGETIPELMSRVVRLAGKSHAVELFKKCQEVERNGGMLTQSRNRRRTPGGVFMKLFNESEKIGEEQKKAMHEFSIEKQRQSGGFPKWWEKMKQKRKKRADEAKRTDGNANEVEELVELPNCNELIKPELLNATELTKRGGEAEPELPPGDGQSV